MSSIGIDWKILLPQIVNFLILFLILRWLLYKPILKMLNERKKRVDDSLALAEKTKLESEQLEKKNQEKIEKIKEEAKKILDETRERVKIESDNKKLETEKDIEKLKLKSKKEIEFERSKTIDSLKKELAELILLASGKLSEKSISIEVQDKLVEEIIEELKNKDLDRL